MTGLTSEQAKERQAQYGRNVLEAPKRISLPRKILSVIKEPMFLLLLVATVVYFALGEVKDGIWMLFFVFAIIGIDAVQEWKTDKTLAALRQLAEPHVAVLRDGEEKIINSADLVPGDIMRVSEGVKIPADGVCVEPHDLCVDESTLTGEPEGVWKNEGDAVYAGTLALQGLSLVEVTAIGTATVFGGIGKQVAEAPDRPTPLEKQVGKLIKLMAGIAAVFFALVTGFSFMAAQGTLGDRATHGLLAGVTLAMALIPEEFPVILTVFLSMGAWRLAKRQSLVRRLSCVETLGAVSVLCVDKTGTITQNRMTVCDTWTPGGDTAALIETMGLACEEDAYDPMEKAMVTYCGEQGFSSEHLFGGELLHEYAFTNERKMMGHVWRHEGALLV
ncbi:MAG: HAD-IC family P-type ATPase, partial [Oscillospiraceae bacterium]|nr:HAD-IC family P-type ATPase [Oscillospiraceae bacterium]